MDVISKSKLSRVVYCDQPSSRDSKEIRPIRTGHSWSSRHGLHELRQGQVSAGPSLQLPSLGSAQRSHLQQGRRDGHLHPCWKFTTNIT